MTVAVIGGSVAGLAAALFCANRDLPVTLVEADVAASPDRTIDEMMARAPRRPTPQSAHSHAFLARGHRILAAEAPDVLDAMASYGVEMVKLADRLPSTLTDRTPRLGDEDLVVILARRSLYEAVLRSVVARHPGVSVRSGVEVTDLIWADGTGPPRVRGVHTTNGPILAGVVLDASGRRSRLPGLLADNGTPMIETSSDCGIAYYTRFYRLYLGERQGRLNRGYTAGSSFDRYSCLVFPADNDTFSVTFGILPEDRALRHLRHDEAFDAATRSIPLIDSWTSRAGPISPVRSMTGMKNRLRRLVTDGDGTRNPVITGFIPLADAAAISNPAHSRGCSLALAHARRVADLVASGLYDTDLALAADRAVIEELVPWVADSARQDEARLSRWRPDGPHRAPEPADDEITNGEAWIAAHHDRDVWQAFTRLQQLLADGSEVLADPEIVARTRSVRQRGLGLPPIAAPDHDTFAGILAANGPASSDRHRVRVAAGR